MNTQTVTYLPPTPREEIIDRPYDKFSIDYKTEDPHSITSDVFVDTLGWKYKQEDTQEDWRLRRRNLIQETEENIYDGGYEF